MPKWHKKGPIKKKVTEHFLYKLKCCRKMTINRESYRTLSIQMIKSPKNWQLIKKVTETRHAGYCWRSKDELISDVLLWTPTHGCARVGRPARTYIQQLCEDTGCNPEDLPEAMNDREKWRETVRDIRAGGATWWWWQRKLQNPFYTNDKVA